MKTELVKIIDNLGDSVTGLKGICSEMVVLELLLEEAADPKSAKPGMQILAEAVGSIRMHLEKVEGDVSSAIDAIMAQN